MTTEQIAATLLEIADFLKKKDDPAEPEPTFTLPPCAPGMEWHCPDGWTAEDLPQGWRPLTHGEIVQKNDEVKNANLDGNCFIAALGSIGWEVGYTHKNQYCRTRRPLIFTHAGKKWTWHRPGDPMPCDGDREVEVMLASGNPIFHSRCGNLWLWNERGGDSIIGWRYADEKKTVPLGPEDVMPFTVIRRKGEAEKWHWRTVSYVDAVKVTCGNRGYEWDELASDYERNESLPLTGKWNPDAWEPCHKPA